MQLILTTVGPNPSELIEELAHLIRDCRCTTIEARVTELSGACAAHVLVEGNWNHIARLESSLEGASTRLGWKIRTSRIEETSAPQSGEEDLFIPYSVDIYAPDRVETFHEVVTFFVARGVRVHDAAISRYPAPISASPLFSAHLVIQVPAEIRIISLRDEFLDFCDQNHLDGILEPVKR